ncbi:MAG: ABC transporter ATP-binding protein [Candidatus Eiseniibacteriota bacterium]
MLEGLGLEAGYPAAHGDPPKLIGPLGPLGPIDLALTPGEWVGLVGGNGSGKTTVLLTLAGLLAPRAGAVRIDGEDAGDPGTQARTRLGFVFQEPESQFVCDSVAREIAFPLENLGWPRERIRARVHELVEELDLSALVDAPPSHLSGGEMQRVALATALAAEPRYLLLDEPGSHLDPPSRAHLLSLTKRLAREAGLGVLWAACSEEECAGADRIVRLPPSAGSPSATGLGTVLEVPDGPGIGPGTGSTGPVDSDPLWVAHGISLTLRDARGGVRLWGGLEFEIARGEEVAIAGASGSGKTALLETLIGWHRPSEGSLSGGALLGEPRPRLGYLTQYPEAQLFAATVREDVRFGIRHRATPRFDSNHGSRERWIEARVDAALESVGFEPAAIGPRAPDALSLGERRRVALAGVLACEPVAVLLDEPFASLDSTAATRLREILESLRSRGVAVLLASHEPTDSHRPGGKKIRLGDPRRYASGQLSTLSRTP